MLGLVDFFGASFIVFIMSIAEMVAIFWIYGTWSTNHVKLWQFVADLITFFFGPFRCESAVSWYWIYVWPKSGLILAPVLGRINSSRYDYHSVVHICNVQTVDLSRLYLSRYSIRYNPFTSHSKFDSSSFPLFFLWHEKTTAIGWTIAAFGLVQLPLWAFVAVVKQKGNSWTEKVRAAFRPAEKWGPSDPITFEKYQKYISQWKVDMQNQPAKSIFGRIKRKLFD